MVQYALAETEQYKAEDFYASEIITPLRRMITVLTYQNDLPRSIGICAAFRREGVTYVSLAMGAVLASDLTQRVCIIDLNWHHSNLLAQAQRSERHSASARRPSWWPWHRRKVEDAGNVSVDSYVPGVADILSGKISTEQAFIPTLLPNLHILPAGELPEHRRSLVARSAALGELLADVHARFEYVLLDIPAVLYTSDSIALASLSQSVALVTRQGVTPMNAVKSALDEIKHLPVLGVLLNQVRIYTPRLIRHFIPEE